MRTRVSFVSITRSTLAALGLALFFANKKMVMAATASTSLNSVISMYQNLIKEWNKKPPNLDVVGKLLTSMKVGIHRFEFIHS